MRGCPVASIAELVDSATIDSLVMPANARLGHQLADGGEVLVTDSGPVRVGAQVGVAAAAASGDVSCFGQT